MRNKYGYTQEDLANIIGVSKQTVSNWETGLKNPRMGAIQKMSEHFNVSKSFIIEGIEYSDITDIYNKLENPRKEKVYNFAKVQLDEQNSSNIITLTEYHEIYLQSKVSAGTGILDLDPNHPETISYKGRLPRFYDLAFKVEGNSMKPTFDDGDIIFVEKIEEPINGALMVVQVDEEAFVKKVYIENDQLRLVSLNTAEYKDIYANSNNNIRIVGKVVF